LELPESMRGKWEEECTVENELEHYRRKSAELERMYGQLEDRFNKIFQASPQMMTITTLKEGRMIDLNEASASLGGFKREELIGIAESQRRLWADPKQRDFVIQRLQKEGSVHNLVVDLLSKTGAVHKVLFSADPITVNDEPCLLSVSVDLTALGNKADLLRESEENYRTLLENSLQGLSILQDGRFIFCNKAFADMTGYSVDELLSLSEKDMIAKVHEEDRERTIERLRARGAGESVPARWEFRITGKDGAEIWLEVFSSPIEYNGRPAIQSAYMNVTERKMGENALRESEERFRLIAETIDEIFWIFDLDKSLMTYISPAFKRICGYSFRRFADNPLSALESVHPDDRERTMAGFSLMKTGQQLDFETRIIRPDGSIRHLWNRGFPIADGTGRVQRYVGVAQDITAWRETEEKLKESTEYLNQIINCLGDPIFVKDRQHRLVVVNEAFCTFSGTRREEMLGKATDEYLPSALASFLWEQEEGVFETGKESVGEENVPEGEGKIRTVMAKKTLLTDKNGNKQIVGVLRDITSYKHLQAQFLQAQKMEAIGVLAGGIAHDFNNLLNVINGYCELILSSLSENDPLRKDIEQVGLAGQKATSLTSQLLAFSRKQILQPKIVDLNGVIGDMHSMLRRLVPENIDLVTVLQPQLGPINADPVQIQQVILNLVVNARDAIPKGGTLIIETADIDLEEQYVRNHPTVTSGRYVMLAISDSGLGMDEETKAHLFEPFFTTKEKGKGTGLGLSTVYGIVKQSNGYIWVYSEPGNGTTFKIYFPRMEHPGARIAAEKKAHSELRGSETVLVAEDESAVRDLACRILRGRGYTVFDAANGRNALAFAQKYSGKIHLVLTDVVMPGMSGRDLVDQLKSTRPGIKALYVSGYTDNAILHHGILDSGVAFLQKPFSVESLLHKMREVLDKI
jgi:two-component system, cell cycle sensor histidine kinase and response regulator CckA